MNKDKELKDLLKIKSEILCYGIKRNDISDNIYDMEHRTKVQRTSNMGLQFMLSDDIIVSVPYSKRENIKSEYYLSKFEDKLYLTNDKITIEVSPFPLSSPFWYDYKLKNGKFFSDYIQKEGKDVLICSVSSSCCYFSKNEQCAFCALNGGSVIKENDRIDSIIEALKVILVEDDSINSINLTGGNLYTSDRGARQYESILREIRVLSDVPIAVEISPPEDLNIIEELHTLGATAIEMNVEIWDDEIRKSLMPGKSQIKRDYYVEAWKKAVAIFGKCNVGSAIIIGLESLESSLEGIKTMIDVGCLPSIIPFKPTKGSVLENHECSNPKDVCEATEYASKLLVDKNLSLLNGPGCIGCGACTLESDFFRKQKEGVVKREK